MHGPPSLRGGGGGGDGGGFLASVVGVAAREPRNLFLLLLHGLEEEEACNVCECGVDGVGGVCMRRVWPNCETAIPKLKGRRNRFESLLVTF